MNEIQEIKQRFLLAVETLLNKGQVDMALQSVNQAISILGNDTDMLAIKSMLEEEIGQ